MLEFTNDVLTAVMLDPVEDRDRLGPRYCWGGYLHQLRDAEGRELWSGPEFPARPSAFNGQGAPEVFCYQNYRTGAAINMDGERGIILGIGAFDRMANGEPVLYDICEWNRSLEETACIMNTQYSAQGWSYHLERRWELAGPTATSSTRVQNVGEKDLDVLWFPHPFFPLVDGGMDFSLNRPFEMDANPGFRREGQRISMIPGFDWKTGRLEWLRPAGEGPLEARFRHPVVGAATMTLDIPLLQLPLWANAHTISLEPYAYHRLLSGQSCAWSLTYRFGT